MALPQNAIIHSAVAEYEIVDRLALAANAYRRREYDLGSDSSTLNRLQGRLDQFYMSSFSLFTTISMTLQDYLSLCPWRARTDGDDENDRLK